MSGRGLLVDRRHHGTPAPTVRPWLAQVNALARSRPAHARSRAHAASLVTRSIADAHPSTSVGSRSRPPVAHDFGQGAAIGRKNGHAGRHRFERREPEALVERGQDQRARAGEQCFATIVGDVADVFDSVVERRLRHACEPFVRIRCGAARDDESRRRRRPREPRERVENHARRSCGPRACPAAARSHLTARAALRRASSTRAPREDSSRHGPQAHRVARRSVAAFGGVSAGFPPRASLPRLPAWPVSLSRHERAHARNRQPPRSPV